MSEKPQWLQQEEIRLSNTPIVMPVGVKPPTTEEVAWEQLKKTTEPVQPSNPSTEEVAVRQLIKQARKNTITRIIEKVKQIEDEV